jgi:hypothetical protein
MAESTTIINQNVTSRSQRGGITAHTVNIGSPRRVMGEKLKKGLLGHLPRGKQIVVWHVSGDDECASFAAAIFKFLQENGFSLFGSGTMANIYLTPLRGVMIQEQGDRWNVHVGFFDGTETVKA